MYQHRVVDTLSPSLQWKQFRYFLIKCKLLKEPTVETQGHHAFHLLIWYWNPTALWLILLSQNRFLPLIFLNFRSSGSSRQHSFSLPLLQYIQQIYLNICPHSLHLSLMIRQPIITPQKPHHSFKNTIFCYKHGWKLESSVHVNFSLFVSVSVLQLS